MLCDTLYIMSHATYEGRIQGGTAAAQFHHHGTVQEYLPEDRPAVLITEEAITAHILESLHFFNKSEQKQFITISSRHARKVFDTAILAGLDDAFLYRLNNELEISDRKLTIEPGYSPIVRLPGGRYTAESWRHQASE